MARMNLSADVDSGPNRKSQLMISAFQESVLPVATEYTQVRDITDFEVRELTHEMFNVVPYHYSRNYVEGAWDASEEVESADSIADLSGERSVHPDLELWAVTNTVQARDMPRGVSCGPSMGDGS